MSYPFQIVDDFPHRVREIENAWIPMSDGTRLAARVWLPENAQREPVPAILEYLPYRKRDGTAERDSIAHPYLAGHGYAGVRVDLRGSGESDGVLEDEYLQRELDDGVEVIRWIANQPWCTGSVGMMGISWGGFNGLQIAAMQPPELKSIVTLCSTDDRYADDVHYMGGCLLGDNLSWASTMFAYTASPPDPALVGDKWREMWQARLEGSGFWLEDWLEHQHRDAYWKHGSICEDFSAVKVPVFAVSGWADAYSNAVFRLLANLDVPRLGLVGPWSHKYPHIGTPGPAIGFLQEMLRWWDHWLKGRDTGIMREPMLRAWMQDSMPPSTGYAERPGHWVGEPEWPSPNVELQRHRLAPHHVLPADSGATLPNRFHATGDESGVAAPNPEIPEAALNIESPASVGLFGGKWCSENAPPDLPDDQREEDGGSLVFQTAPFTEPLEILGAPFVTLDLSSDQPVAMVAARLSDVAPDGRATRVTYGMLNLTHRESNEHPQPLVPHQRYRVKVRLNDVAQHFPAGHCLRLSLSTSYWPLAWLPPKPTMLTIHPATSELALPVRPPREEDSRLSGFPPAEGARPLEREVVRTPDHEWRVVRDLGKNEFSWEVEKDRGRWLFEDIGWEVGSRADEKYSLKPAEFESARGETHWDRTFRRGDWFVRTVTRTILTCDAECFRIRAELDAWEGDTRVYCRTWDRRIPRRLV